MFVVTKIYYLREDCTLPQEIRMNRLECVEKIAEYLYSFTKGTFVEYINDRGDICERAVTFEDEIGRAEFILTAQKSLQYCPNTVDGWGLIMRSRSPIKEWFEEFSGTADEPLHSQYEPRIAIKRSKVSEETRRAKRIKEKVKKFKQEGLW